jgi:hypothetical protein
MEDPHGKCSMFRNNGHLLETRRYFRLQNSPGPLASTYLFETNRFPCRQNLAFLLALINGSGSKRARVSDSSLTSFLFSRLKYRRISMELN